MGGISCACTISALGCNAVLRLSPLATRLVAVSCICSGLCSKILVAIWQVAWSELHLTGLDCLVSAAWDVACHITKDALPLQQSTELRGLSCAWPVNSSHPTRASGA